MQNKSKLSWITSWKHIPCEEHWSMRSRHLYVKNNHPIQLIFFLMQWQCESFDWFLFSRGSSSTKQCYWQSLSQIDNFLVWMYRFDKFFASFVLTPMCWWRQLKLSVTMSKHLVEWSRSRGFTWAICPLLMSRICFSVLGHQNTKRTVLPWDNEWNRMNIIEKISFERNSSWISLY